ncbi:oligosaccharyl transferase [Methanosarcina sp. 2.H.T.1A.6]|uniref:oligosaccharyl transferase, archaeosortase A system-associated n=1 Tax=unclassified Methanosarcina TaxID=2644672 RepID=UPI000622AE7E|nr:MULTISPECIES: oligosaccharyl transferase, archaeosortase A system-associated [unclassified Methanosarcina]KKG18660.1 oligosaccharyl transferase [Methanosarcina sp. 2.H.T.1A.3]KKG21694.1 oligosaccharyl transferase [Methanosarcina sp. 2.H.T.1A.6]KKG23584.1 oligosaccharyl transferase [Methanosarcina sp. 2.H.T.1A.15]KKG23689.1 oligosaccharyl transferase [Methanosarcina sp. 2.H.T.1A.8]
MSSQDRPVSTFKSKIKSSLPYTLAVAVIGFVALWIRTRPYDSVFLSNGFVRFGGNDPWYHMRTLNVLIENYPQRMFFNPMTNYPYGSYIHFGPLFDQMIAITTLILGMGNPSPELVNGVGAYFPAVLGAITVIPVYYIGKSLGSRKTGILAAILIAFAPGQFLSRSVIGFTDHHVAETLFSTFFMMYFMLAVISAKKKGLRFEHVINKELNTLKEPLICSVMAGVMYSAYQLAWPGASLFLFVILVYILFQYILNNFRNESSDYLGITGIVTFLISAILILPFVHPEMGFSMYYYSWFHVVTPLGTVVGFMTLSFIEREREKRKIQAYYYPLIIFGIIILGLLLAKIVVPPLYSLVIGAPEAIFGIKTGGASTIGEASSIFYYGGVFTLSRAFDNFTATGFLASVLGMLLLAVNLVRKPKPEEVLVLVWSLLMLLAIYGQNRFAYYYSVNVAVLSAFVGGLLLEKVKWSQLNEKFKSNVKSLADIPGFLKFVKIEQVIAVLIIVVVLILPVYGSAMEMTKGTGGPNGPWIEATTWLQSYTPDLGMDYNAIYEAPEAGELFDYPDTAYGIMSWWDYGHWIETIGHRIPNANPFQAGIGGRRGSIDEENKPGSSTFFTAQSEEEATAVLEAVDPDPDKAGARYIISDVEMATGKFYAMTAWTLDSEGYYQSYWTGSGYQSLPSTRYFNSMESRLHILDGNGLKQYRLVHETWAYQTQEVGYKQVYNYLFGGSIPEADTGYVKIFEYVKGAKITGTVSPNETVNINTTILTGQGRTFDYSQSTTSDSEGRYEFTVPYSTEGPISGETQFDTAPAGAYVVSYGNTTTEVRVSEEAVLKGEEVKVKV